MVENYCAKLLRSISNVGVNCSGQGQTDISADRRWTGRQNPNNMHSAYRGGGGERDI